MDAYVAAVLARAIHARVIFIFLSKKDEIDTAPIIAALQQEGRTLVVPVCAADKQLHTVLLRADTELVPGLFGIPQPRLLIPVDKKEIDLFVVPGTQFDLQGNRVGRGQGYFDRFLADVKGKKPIVGLCKKEQVVESLARNPWDIPVDEVISD